MSLIVHKSDSLVIFKKDMLVFVKNKLVSGRWKVEKDLVPLTDGNLYADSNFLIITVDHK